MILFVFSNMISEWNLPLRGVNDDIHKNDWQMLNVYIAYIHCVCSPNTLCM